jgi:hypothetical protein
MLFGMEKIDIPGLIKPGPPTLPFYYNERIVGTAYGQGSWGYRPDLPDGFREQHPDKNFKTSLMLTDDKVPRGILIEDA